MISAEYLAQLAAWKEDRLAKLKAPDGWLNIIGRWWLEPGTVSMGSAPGNDIVLPVGPERLASLTQAAEGDVEIVPVDGSAPSRLAPNKKQPPKLLLSGLLLELTTINGQNALRVRDTRSDLPTRFPGIDSFEPREEWRIVAEWVPFEVPLGLTVDTTKSIPTEVEATHRAIFSHAGTRVELLATHGTPQAPQFVIRDETSRDMTYPASRFVYGENVGETTIVIDFNKAINPPCVFTEHAVCPLPPPENVLPFRVEAGEKRIVGWPPE